MRVSSVGSKQLAGLSNDQVGILVDLCDAGVCSVHIAQLPEWGEEVDAVLWQVQQSLLPAVTLVSVAEAAQRSG